MLGLIIVPVWLFFVLKDREQFSRAVAGALPPGWRADSANVLALLGRIGGRWVHLRMCQTCGHIGCCDNSPGRHATGHYAATSHPVMRSAEPGEDWSWCYADELMFRLARE